MRLLRIMGVVFILAMMGSACGKGDKVHGTQEGLNLKQLTTEQHHQDGIEAFYPRFISGGKESKLSRWNEIIEKDFNKILHIYAFEPFPEPSPSPGIAVPTILTLGYETKLNNERLASFFYTAAFKSPYSAHPTNLVYTTNIDKIEDKRLKLSDSVNLNQDFVKDFRTWDFITSEEGNEDLNKAIKDYMDSLTDEDLLMGMEAADQIGSRNIWDIYSYLTPDRLGISIGVPNYAGDHVEFEREYTQIEKYLKEDFIKP